jgi:hypothetical protein
MYELPATRGGLDNRLRRRLWRNNRAAYSRVCDHMFGGGGMDVDGELLSRLQPSRRPSLVGDYSLGGRWVRNERGGTPRIREMGTLAPVGACGSVVLRCWGTPASLVGAMTNPKSSIQRNLENSSRQCPDRAQRGRTERAGGARHDASAASSAFRGLRRTSRHRATSRTVLPRAWAPRHPLQRTCRAAAR